MAAVRHPHVRQLLLVFARLSREAVGFDSEWGNWCFVYLFASRTPIESGQSQWSWWLASGELDIVSALPVNHAISLTLLFVPMP